MAKDPAFLFYPGDYLKDTQCLSEAAQVAYDRIMCEHMRNISEDMNNITVSKERVNFFTKRLNEEQRAEIFHVLTLIEGGYQIEWVAESICKRKSYSISRANNRKKTHENISSDMVIANVNEDVIENKVVFKGVQGETWDALKLKWKSDWRWIDKFAMDGGYDRLLVLKRMDEFLADLDMKEDYKDIPGLKKHFFHWHKKHHNGSQINRGTTATGTSGAKLGTSDARTEALRKW